MTPRTKFEGWHATPNGNVSYCLPKAFYTGETHVILPPVEFLRRLAALIPPPRFQTWDWPQYVVPGSVPNFGRVTPFSVG